MQNLPATLTATFSAAHSTLILSGHSPNITHAPLGKPLVDYLSFLSVDGWRITRAVFEGFTLNLELEKAADASSPIAPVPIYLFHSFFISYFGLKAGLPSGLRPGTPAVLPAALTGGELAMGSLDNAARDQKALSEQFNETIRADGWQELCTSRLLRTTGHWILSLWMRELAA